MKKYLVLVIFLCMLSCTSEHDDLIRITSSLNKDLPRCMYEDCSLEWTSIEYDKIRNEVVYKYTFKSVNDVDLQSFDSEDTKLALKNELLKNIIANESFVKVCIDNEANVKFIFLINDASNILTVKISNEEIITLKNRQ